MGWVGGILYQAKQGHHMESGMALHRNGLRHI
jgi:hypothetical protein